jgi:putative SOS response-associated peptidase YedK
MCTNFTPTRNNAWVKTHFGVQIPDADYPIEAYPGYLAPIIVKSHQTGRIASGLARFGLIPAWAKDDKISRHTYNARAETVQEKPSYRTAWRLRRLGIALLDNFYEPSYVTGKAERWEIKLAAHEPLGIASLWDTWTDPQSGQLITSFTMLTINADSHPVMKQFHKPEDEKRTPLVLATNQFNDWLNADPQIVASMLNSISMPELICQSALKNKNV